MEREEIRLEEKDRDEGHGLWTYFNKRADILLYRLLSSYSFMYIG